MSILCLDLGTTFGWAVLEDGELIDYGEGNLPPPSNPMGARWAGFRDWIAPRLDDGVKAVVYEQPFGRYQNVLQIQFGMATVLELEAEDRGLEYMGLQPSHIKKFATGRGNCKKAEMTSSLMERYREFDVPAPPADIGPDAVDAIWCALYVAAELSVEAVGVAP